MRTVGTFCQSSKTNDNPVPIKLQTQWGHSFSTYGRMAGGGRQRRTPMYCFHSDVIICAYKGGVGLGGGGVQNMEIYAYILNECPQNA